MKKAEFEIRIKGNRKGRPLTPQLLDVDEWIGILQNARNLLFPEGGKVREQIGVAINRDETEVKLTAKPTVIIKTDALLSYVNKEQDLSDLHPRQAEAVEYFQRFAEANHFTLQIGKSGNTRGGLFVDRNTHLQRLEATWLPVEMYATGILTNAGGKSNPNIHLDTEEHSLLFVAVSQDMLKSDDKNRLYKKQQVRIRILQNQHTGEYDRKSAVLIDFVDFPPPGKSADEQLDELIRLAAKDWKKIKNPEQWLSEIRGYA